MSFDNVTWLQGTSPLQQHLPAMLCKVYTKHSAPQQGQCFKQGISPSSYQSGQGTQPLRVAAARYQGYFPSRSPTPSNGVSRHINHAPLRQSSSKGTKINLSHVPLQHAGGSAYLPRQSELVPLPPLLHCHCGSTSPTVRVAQPNTQANIESSHHYTQPPTNIQQNNQEAAKSLN